MIQFKKHTSADFLLGIVLSGFIALSQASAEENDPGLLRALQTDSASIENTYYFLATFNNNTSPRHWLYFYGQGLFVLGKQWGLEADFPNLETQFPLGQSPLALGPIGLFVRYEAWQFGRWNEETAGALAINLGGAYGIPNSAFPWIGSSWSVEVLGGYRWGRFFIQEECGYQGRIDPQVQSQWEANTSLGYRLTNEWYAQTETDFSADADSSGGTSWSVIPQIAFQPGDWLFEWGEAFNGSSAVYTELMVARAL